MVERHLIDVVGKRFPELTKGPKDAEGKCKIIE
jgi:hypothetical protein